MRVKLERVIDFWSDRSFQIGIKKTNYSKKIFFIKNSRNIINLKKYFRHALATTFIAMLCINISFAQVISEVQYDPDGSDTDREWIEVFNNTNEFIKLSDFKFFENNVNHGITAVGDANVGSGEYVLIVQDVNKFKTDYPNYSGKLFTSSFSLSNSGEYLAIKSKDGMLTSEVNYAGMLSGAGGGKTINNNGSSWVANSPTPGTGQLTVGAVTTPNSNTSATLSSTTTLQNTNATSTTTTLETIFNPSYYVSRPWPIADKIYVNAGENKIVVSGVEIPFSGKVLGSDQKPASGASFNWNFGDGYTKQGEIVSHKYMYPGEYTVTLEVFLNGSLENDTIYVKAIAPQVSLKINDRVEEDNLGQKKYSKLVEIKNNSINQLSLDGLYLRTFGSKNLIFKIPKNTSLLSGRSIYFGEDLLKSDSALEFASLEYENGKIIADSGKKEIFIPKILSLPFATTATATSPVFVFTKEEYEKNKRIINKDIFTSSSTTKKILTKNYFPIRKDAIARKNELAATTTAEMVSNKIILGNRKKEESFLSSFLNIFSN